MIVEKQMECRLTGETEVLGENLPQRHLCPSQNPTRPGPDLNIITFNNVTMCKGFICFEIWVTSGGLY
jgi:hypothetical protein